METCLRCKKKMSSADVTTCEGYDSVKDPDGEVLEPVPYNPKELHLPNWYRCPDCNIVPGGKHHANCDQEICPRCGGQLLSCDCFDTPDVKKEK